jgi:hypothetical protein
MLDTRDVTQFYSGRTPDGKMILTPAFKAAIERCYQHDGLDDTKGRANDSAGIVRCDRADVPRFPDGREYECSYLYSRRADGQWEVDPEKMRRYCTPVPPLGHAKACDAAPAARDDDALDPEASPDRYAELQKMVDAKRGQYPGLTREQQTPPALGDFGEIDAQKTRDRGQRALGGSMDRDMFRRDRNIHHTSDAEVDRLIALERMYDAARRQRRAN